LITKKNRVRGGGKGEEGGKRARCIQRTAIKKKRGEVTGCHRESKARAGKTKGDGGGQFQYRRKGGQGDGLPQWIGGNPGEISRGGEMSKLHLRERGGDSRRRKQLRDYRSVSWALKKKKHEGEEKKGREKTS